MVAALAIASLAYAARGQETPAETSNAQTATPIPIPEIIARAEETTATLKKIEANAASDPTTDVIERELPPLTREIDSRLDETAQLIRSRASLDKFKTFEADWRSLTSSLPVWKSELTERATQLEADFGRLGQLDETWQQTLDLAKNSSAPPEVIAQIEAIIAAIGQTREFVEGQRGPYSHASKTRERTGEAR